jgi:glycosyltransferase involved in cell wall biosynthesis
MGAMKISGFSFVRDGVRFGYPFEESIRSALPLCDEFIVAVGEGQDGTLERLRAMDEPKLRILPTRWNENIRRHGYVYAQQKMIAQFNCTGDWALYLESDELLHEDELDRLRHIMEKALHDPRVEALAFNYHHFWGEPGLVRNTPGLYRKATRAIRNDLRSIAPDGLYWAVIRDRNLIGRRNKRRTRYPRALDTGVHIYHYGNTRAEHYLKPRARTVNQYWSRKIWFDQYGNISPATVEPFAGTHPRAIREWLVEHGNQELKFNPDHRLSRRQRKHLILAALERKFGWDFSKKHFRIVASAADFDPKN